MKTVEPLTNANGISFCNLISPDTYTSIIKSQISNQYTISTRPSS